MSDYLPLPKVTDRKKGQIYMRKNEIVIWNGDRLVCKHTKRKTNCIKCGGNKLCESDGCEKWASHNFEGETKGKFCATHKLKKMINLKKDNRICEHIGCKKEATYNFRGETKRRFCSKHILKGMVPTSKCRTCEHVECEIQPCYNFPGEIIGRFCVTHQLDGMIDVKNHKCEYKGCNTTPHFNFNGETKGKFCFTHRTEGMVDVVERRICVNEWCSNRRVSNIKYDGYCLFCYVNMFPDKPVARNYKTKEYAVVEYITQEFPDYTWIADRQIQDGCSKKRPDLLLDLGFQIVNIEIDENQHERYDCSCENKRIMQLSQDVGHRPIVFIRFNPDGYTKDGEKISSCWEYNKQGICVLNKSKQKEWEQRLEILKNEIIYWSDESNITDKTIETIQLFYDE